MKAIDALIDHLLGRGYDDLPATAVAAAKACITDAVGVGLAGARHPRMPQVLAAMARMGTGGDAAVWGSGQRLPLPSAALVNAYQVFNQEYDCVHDGAVVHALASLLPTTLGYAQAHGGVSGRDLIAAVVLGLDVAIHIGLAQRAPMRFFRPAMCGGLGATAALARLGRLDRTQTADALGLMYSHLSGTMQAHAEGSPAVGMQVGFNARAACTAFELAAAGFPGPRDILEGPFGYFALFDGGQSCWDAVAPGLGQVFQIERMSHKPYPTGRATHGGIEGAIALRDRHGVRADDVGAVRVHASALVQRLVGRPSMPGMDSGYARLCMSYGVACALLRGHVDLDDFDPPALADVRRLALADRVEVVVDPAIDAQALAGPQRVELQLHDGTRLQADIAHVLGHPDHPLPAAQRQRKFAHCCARVGMGDAQVAELLQTLGRLDECPDVRDWAALLVCPAP